MMDTRQIKFELYGVTYRVPCVIEHYYDDASDGRCYRATCEFGGRTFETDRESGTLAMFNLKRKLMEEIEQRHQRELVKLEEWNAGKAIVGER
jgi:hypothetical protein